MKRVAMILAEAAITAMPISLAAGAGNPIPESEIDENKMKTYYVETGESSWVPIISAGVIVLLVFGISLFACCLHCPGCCIHQRGEPNRIV